MSHQLTGAFTVEIDTGRLVEEIAQRTAVILVGMIRAAPAGEYAREPDPGQGGADPHRGRRTDDQLGMDGLPDAGRLRVWLAVLLAVLALAGAAAFHQWSESQGEDHAPLWSCHTMGNGECGPGSPWHGITTRP